MVFSSNKPWHRQSVKDVLDYYKVDYTKGLSSNEALKRLASFGVNKDATLPRSSSYLYQAVVYRDSKLKKISVLNVVVGDIVVISKGDRVPADLRLLKVNKLATDEIHIGGGHLVYKNTFAITDADDSSNIKCIAQKGSIVVEGSGVGVVVATNLNNIKQTNNRFNKRISITNRSLAKKYQKKGLLVQDYDVFNILKKVDTVVFFGIFDNEFIFNTINKLQLQKNIHCLFVLDDLSHSLARALPDNAIKNYVTDIHNNNTASITNSLKLANIVIDKGGNNFIKIVNILKKPGSKILAVINSNQNSQNINSADASIVVGSEVKDSIALAASIRTLQLNPNILDSILYNKI